MRLAKFLANAGVASRRAAERFIAAKRVSVNGQFVFDPALDVSENDTVTVDGVRIEAGDRGELIYLMLHKPEGVVSTMQIGREKGFCLSDLVQIERRVHPVGRLDRDSSGLILLTNDGNLTYRLIHPRYKVEKEYLVKLQKPLQIQQIDRLMKGVAIDGSKVEIDAFRPAAGGRISLTIHEGRKRILRRLFAEIGNKVLELKRVRIGNLRLGRLGRGRWRYLKDAEIDALKKLL